MHFWPSKALQIPPTIFETIPRIVKPLSLGTAGPAPSPVTATRTSAAPFQLRPMMATTSAAPGSHAAAFAEYHIRSRLPASGAADRLTARQSLLAASVLDLFAGHPSKRKLSLWADDAAFYDPLTRAQGRKQYEAQWYGLKAVMSAIEQESVEVVSVGNPSPIELRLRSRYKVKAVGQEQVIDSRVLVHHAADGDGGRITQVEDRWGGDVPPDSIFAKALRNLNSVSVPAFVHVPASIEEEEKAWAAKR